MSAVFFALCLIVGLVWGSFLNVAIYRLPLAEGAGRNPLAFLCLPLSYCPHCGAGLKARHLVPLFSYLFLRGESDCCRRKIGWRYPLVEAAGAGIVLASALGFGWGLDAALACAFLSALLVASAIDLARYRLPDTVTLPLLWLGLLANLDSRFALPQDALWGAAGGYLALLFFSEAAEFLLRKPALGRGDCKLFAAAGAWLGWQALPFVLFAAALLGLIFAGVRKIVRGRARLIPFGPCIAVAAAAMLFFGERLMTYYWLFVGR